MGARGSQQSATLVVEAVTEEAAPAECVTIAPVAVDASEIVLEEALLDEAKAKARAAFRAAMLVDVDEAEESPATAEVAKVADARHSGAYLVALAQCAQLRKKREELLQARTEVRATIAQFAPAFDHNNDNASQSSDNEDDEEDEESCEEGKESPCSRKQAERLSYEDLLLEQEELEDEVETLRSTLDQAADMIGAIARASMELSGHLEEVGSGVRLPIQTPARPTSPTVKADTSSFELAPSQVFNIPTPTSKTRSRVFKDDEAKFSNLKMLATPVAAGSEASSSTATPRSENSSESRLVSALGEGCCLAAA